MRCFLLALAATAAPSHAAPSQAAPSYAWFDTALPRAQRVSALLAAMTDAEKIAQLVVGTPAIARLGVKSYHWRNNILHGTVDNGVSTQFPQAVGMAASWDPAGLRRAARVMSDEQRAKHNIMKAQQGGNSIMDYGLDLWGPNINMFRDPRWGRGQETYGEDPFLTSSLLRSFVGGLQQGAQTQNALGERFYETLATCKHFAGYTVDEMPPRLSFDPNVSQTDLRQYFLPAWEACASTAVSVMCSYNGLNGNPMCMSPMIEGVLRAEFNFSRHPENYVVTDSGAVDFMVSKMCKDPAADPRHCVHKFSSTVDAAVASFHAGVDLNSGSEFSKMGPMLSNNTITAAQVDTALTRLFHARMSLGLFDPDNATVYSQLGPADVMSEAHRDEALSMSEKSILMLRNVGELLPLKASTLKKKKIAVIGWGANDTYATLANYMGCGFGSWSPRLKNCSIITPLGGIRKRFAKLGVDVSFSHGCDVESNSTAGFAAAVALAKAADVVLYVGGNRNCEGGQGHGGAHCESEGHDRPDLEMPGVQTALLKLLHAANPNVVLAMLTGGPISINWEAQNIPSILTIWYGGELMGEALANAMAGDVSPAGRSPYTWPTGLSQVPPELEMSPAFPPGRTYRYLTQVPLFSFGFGLSYGKFAYSAGRVAPEHVAAGSAAKEVAVCAEIANVGSLASEEVVQAYASPAGSVNADSPPRSQLIGFERTQVLAPGDKATVCISVELSSLRLMAQGGTTQSDYRVLSGEYTITISGKSPGPAGKYVAKGEDDAVTVQLSIGS